MIINHDHKRGASAPEYAVLLGLVLVAVAGVAASIGGRVGGLLGIGGSHVAAASSVADQPSDHAGGQAAARAIVWDTPGNLGTVSQYAPLMLDQSAITTLIATDPAGGAITYAAPAIPAGLALAAAGTITGTPTGLGPQTFTATATDAAGLTASQQFTLTVSNALRYDYGASVLTDGQTDYIWSCSNQASGVIQDSIFFTTAPAGEVPATLPTTVAVGPSSATPWGSYHLCDPSVVQGQFKYFGHAYSYAMFMTGTPLNASTNNSVGVAFANDPAGPWTVAPSAVIANPYASSAWGEGQPSVVYASGSNVLLTWTDGSPTLTRTEAAWVTLASQAGDVGPGWSVSTPWVVSGAGLKMTTGAGDYLHDADLAYDPASGLVYAARPVGPYPSSGSTQVESAVEVNSLPMASFLVGTGSWVKVGATVGPATSGAGRNDNPSLIRNMDGTLPAGAIGLVDTTSADCLSPLISGCWPASLWTYRLWLTSVSR
jgi:Flp pilus assembly pilin Flp